MVPLCSSDPEPAAGLVDGYMYTRYECPFDVGDLLLGYTDGVLEAADSNGELFGEERLTAITMRHGESSGQVLIDKVVSAAALVW